MMTAALRAGAAKANITPPVGCHLAGYGDPREETSVTAQEDHVAFPGPRTQPSTGINDDLFAKVLVLDDGSSRMALVTLDLIGVGEDLVSQLRNAIHAATGIPGGSVLVAASHTHAGPFTSGAAADPDYLSQLGKKIAGAASVATRTMTPANLRFGWGDAEIGANRRVVTPEGAFMRPNPAGPVDRRVGVLRVDTAEASPLAILVLYACHPNVFRHENLRISADYVGAALGLVERVYAGSTALFLQGCGGNIRPNVVGDDGDFCSGTESDRQRLGRILGAAAIKAAEAASPLSPARLSMTVRRILLPVSEAQQNKAQGGKPVEAEVQGLALGQLLIVALPGEPFVEIGQRIRQTVGDPVLVAGYSNGYLGYLPTAQAHTEGGYEAVVSPFAPQTEDLLVASALELAQDLR